MQGIFVKKEPIKKQHKRGHIFHSILSAISEEKESGTMRRDSDTTEGELANDKENLIDYEASFQSDNSESTIPETNPIERNEETPVKILRQRLSITTREYNELLEFARFEKLADLSIEQDMEQKFKRLTEECSNLRASLGLAETKNQAFILEQEKSKQLINDYEYMIESQKIRYEKRERELLGEINELNSNRTAQCDIVDENVPVHMYQMNTFEYEEMSDTIESLNKQNQELHGVIESFGLENHNLKSLEKKNQEFREANKSLKLLNSDLQNQVGSLRSENLKLQNTICAFELQESQMKTMLSKSLEFEVAQDTLSSKNSFLSSIEKQILVLKNKVNELDKDLVKVKTELNDSLDKLLEVTEDLDIEEKKCLELHRQLEKEKKERKQLQIKLEQKELSEHAMRRFSSDSLIHLKSKSLDSNVLHLLFQLKTILDPKSNQRIEIPGNLSHFPEQSSSFNPINLPKEGEKILSGNSSSDSKKIALNIELEKLKSFSSCYVKDSANSIEFMNYFRSVLSENSTLSEKHPRLKIRQELDIEGEKNNLFDENEKLKNELSSMELKWQSDSTKIINLQKQQEDYNYMNLSDSEKIEKTNENSFTSIGTLESLEAKKLNSFLLIEKLNCENVSEDSKHNKLQKILNSSCSERNNGNALLSETHKNVSDSIGLLKSQIQAQEIQIDDLHQLIYKLTNYLSEALKCHTVLEKENEVMLKSANIIVSDIVDRLKDVMKSRHDGDDETMQIIIENVNEELELNTSVMSEEICHSSMLKEQTQSYKNEWNDEGLVIPRRIYDKLSGESGTMENDLMVNNNVSHDQMGEDINQVETKSLKDIEDKLQHSSEEIILHELEDHSLIASSEHIEENKTIFDSKEIHHEEILDSSNDIKKTDLHFNRNKDCNHEIYLKAASILQTLPQEIKLLNNEKVEVPDKNEISFTKNFDNIQTIFDENIVKNLGMNKGLKQHEKLLKELDNLKNMLKDVVLLKKENSEHKQFIQKVKTEISTVLQSSHENSFSSKRFSDENESLLQKTQSLITLHRNQLEIKDRRLEELNRYLLELEEIRNLKYQECESAKQQAIEDITEKKAQILQLNANIETLKKENMDCLILLRAIKNEKSQNEENFKNENIIHLTQVACLKKTNNDINIQIVEKENQCIELIAELKKMKENNSKIQLLYEENKQLLEKIENEKLEIEKKFRNETNNLLSQIDVLEKTCTNNLEKMVESNKNFELLSEKERANFNLLTIKMKNDHLTLIHTMESERQEFQELFKQTKEGLFLQIDSLNRDIENFLIHMEKKERDNQTLNSELHKIVTEKDNYLELIKKLEKEKIEVEQKNSSLIKRLDILEIDNCELKSKISTFENEKVTDQMLEKMCEEISRLKKVLPRDESKKPSLRERLVKYRSQSTKLMKLEDIKYLVDEICSLAQERNLLKSQNEKEYESLKKTHDNLKREFELRKRQYELVFVDLSALKDEHETVRVNYDSSKFEIEQLKNSLKIMKSKNENYESRIENLAFENQDLAKKLCQMEEFKLSYKETENKLQILTDENGILADRLYDLEKQLLKCKKNDRRVEGMTAENGSLVEKIDVLENKIRQLIDCDSSNTKTSMKENTPRVLENLNWNSEVVEKEECENFKYKYERLKKIHQLCVEQNPEIEATSVCKKENKWKQQRTETHDSRRSIDLNTLCLESVVDSCNNCENMSRQLQKTKSEMLQLRKYIESMSTSELEILKFKYEKIKKLCRLRNDEIAKLKQSMLEMK